MFTVEQRGSLMKTALDIEIDLKRTQRQWCVYVCVCVSPLMAYSCVLWGGLTPLCADFTDENRFQGLSFYTKLFAQKRLSIFKLQENPKKEKERKLSLIWCFSLLFLFPSF